MDRQRRDFLIEKCQAATETDPLVTLEEFFEGNDDKGSMGCNLVEHPGLDVFFRTLQVIRARSDVNAVLVRITDWEAEGEAWPFSDAVYIFTDATQKAVKQWVAPLRADDAIEIELALSRSPTLRSGGREWMVWWD